MAQQFVVEGIGSDLARVALRVSADSSDRAQALARERGVQPTSVRRDWVAEGKARLVARPFPAALFFRELALLMRAGLTLNTSLSSLNEKEKRPSTKQVLDELIESITTGGSFAKALARHPEHFPAVARSSIEAAEGAGALADVLDRLAAYLEQGEHLKRRVVGALLYPALVVMVGALVSSYLMFFVVPKFSEVYRDLGPTMPWIARWLVVWADLLSSHRTAVYLVLALPGLALTYVLIDAGSRQRALAWLLSLGPVRARHELFETVQLYRGLVILMSSGASFARALTTMAGSAQGEFKRRIEQSRQQIEGGAAVSDALIASGLATSVSVRLIAAGEQSGSMVQSMTRIAEMHEADLTRDVEWLLKVLEPLLMLAVGVIVGGIVLLLYLPIFELANALG